MFLYALTGYVNERFLFAYETNFNRGFYFYVNAPKTFSSCAIEKKNFPKALTYYNKTKLPTVDTLKIGLFAEQ